LLLVACCSFLLLLHHSSCFLRAASSSCLFWCKVAGLGFRWWGLCSLRCDGRGRAATQGTRRPCWQCRQHSCDTLSRRYASYIPTLPTHLIYPPYIPTSYTHLVYPPYIPLNMDLLMCRLYRPPPPSTPHHFYFYFHVCMGRPYPPRDGPSL
jgi:hypothetical protein